MVRVIVFEEDGALVAQCLEYDICAFAPDEPTLRDRFRAVFNLERNIGLERDGEPFAGIGPAPEEFHQMWNDCMPVDEFEQSGEHLAFAKCA